MNPIACVGLVSLTAVSMALLSQPGTKPGLDHPAPGNAPAVPAQPAAPAQPATPATPAPPTQPELVAGGSRAVTPQMVGAVMASLRKAPGCMGADLGQLQSGKFVIFAWFESKKALLDWYHSTEHQKVASTVWPERDTARVPLADIPDDVGPVMAVAAASPIPAAELKPGQPPSMRLGIEIYKPLPGGIRFSGGSFAPTGFKPGLREIDPAAAPKPE